MARRGGGGLERGEGANPTGGRGPEQRRRDLAAGFAPERVACLWLPRFALRLEQARCGAEGAGSPPGGPAPWGEGPVALVAEAEGREAVLRDCSPEAEAAGLAPGMAVSAAVRRCPEVRLRPFDARFYAERFEALLRALDGASPAVEARPLEVCFLDLGGRRVGEAAGVRRPDLLWMRALREAVRSALGERYGAGEPGGGLRLGIASGKFSAWVAAHAATPGRPRWVAEAEKTRFLSRAPAALLPVSAETLRQMELLGLRTLGQIARLPRAAMLAQFGWEGEWAHRLACGEDREPLRPALRPCTPRETLEFSDSAPTLAHFQAALFTLLERLWRRPERGVAAVRQVRLEARLAAGGVWARTLTLRRPRERPEEAYAELRRRLEADPPAGRLLDLTVELTAFAERIDAQPALFSRVALERQERLRTELEQLRARLGKPAVFRIVEVEPWSRLPERRHALLSYDL